VTDPLAPIDAIAQWRRAAAIVDAALDREGEAREALIRTQCSGDEALEADVRRWLAAADAPSALLTGTALPPDGIPALSSGATPVDALAPHSRVGVWRIVRFLGRGGMGEVYEAIRDDGAFERCVALKVVRTLPGQDRLIRRFLRERALLAGLDHPGIARLLDGGLTDSGLPFYAMELVAGQPIDVWCDARRVDVRGRLRLMMQVFAAVSYAHGRFVIHRDLKPSNILVTDDGTVKVVDFGIARALDTARDTRDHPLDSEGLATAQLRALTPAYASPEHCLGQPTSAASDVYSLAAVAYRLLVGRPPHGTQPSWTAITTAAPLCSAAVITAGDVAVLARDRGTTAARLDDTLRGDVDAIIACGLEPAPSDRYASVEAFARDVQLHLDDRPVSVRPAAWYAQLAKFMRRHRAGTAAALLAAGALTATTAIALVQASRAEQAARRATIASAFVTDLLQLPYPFDSGPSQQRSLRALLDSGRARAAAMRNAGESPGADVLLALSRGYDGLGDTRSAIALAQQALSERVRLSSPASPALLGVRMTLAEAYLRGGEATLAIPQYDTILAIVRQRSGPRSVQVGVVLQAKSRALRGSGDLSAAESAVREVLSIFTDSAGASRVPYATPCSRSATSSRSAGSSPRPRPAIARRLRCVASSTGMPSRSRMTRAMSRELSCDSPALPKQRRCSWPRWRPSGPDSATGIRRPPTMR
jgi:eukaryotic-like serine/threonine-protein kinase